MSHADRKDKKRIVPASTKIQAPFNKEQVRSLNQFQKSGRMHPFTCPRVHHEDTVVLSAATSGWWCPEKGCTYKQNWAHAFMADGSFLDLINEVEPPSEEEWHRRVWKDMSQDERNEILREKGLL